MTNIYIYIYIYIYILVLAAEEIKISVMRKKFQKHRIDCGQIKR